MRLFPGRAANQEARATDFERCVRPWVEEMYRVAAGIVGVAEAADLTQDALLDAWRGFGRLRDRSRVRPWLHAIVANRCRQHLRALGSRPRAITVAPPADWTDRLAEPDQSAEVARRDELDGAFRRLAADEQLVLVLRYGLDLTVGDVAQALSIPEGTVKSRLHHALALLRRTLTEEGDFDG